MGSTQLQWQVMKLSLDVSKEVECSPPPPPLW